MGTFIICVALFITVLSDGKFTSTLLACTFWLFLAYGLLSPKTFGTELRSHVEYFKQGYSQLPNIENK